MTARDIRYGRRGGRWATDKTAADVKPPKSYRRPEDPCRQCPETIGQHTDCRACYLPIEHHVHDQRECWIGLARMATARRAAGVPLDDRDREALARTTRAAA